jgi:hypothetical protein
MKYKLHFNWKYYLLADIGIVIIAAGLMYAILRAVNNWYDTHTITFNKVVNVEFKKPIEIKEREVPTKEIVRVMEEIPHPQDLQTDVEKYIYEVFGIEDYKVAIAIAKAESGLREDAININSNNTIDVGIFQINQIHFKKDGCSLKEVSTMQGNIDCAKQLYDSSGWNPWVAFKNGAFTAKLD